MSVTILKKTTELKSLIFTINFFYDFSHYLIVTNSTIFTYLDFLYSKRVKITLILSQEFYMNKEKINHKIVTIIDDQLNFYIHLVIYVLACGFILAENISNYYESFTLFPLLVWGIVVCVHYIVLYFYNK